ncbi:TPA: WavQ [Vibrio diabolicus]|uniref:WavQ n=1 Tax=Vibrio TaxID=662 RepID=UPI001F48B4DE|nr:MULTISPECIES: WavQ [Vibrio]MCF7454671.1 WavQ [Vibrio sp. A1-1]MCG6238388.1 WavQ [Vibrio diabolicus]MCG9622781.1 WavQ [Vibrio diabolicus]MCR9533392.1 WavQ [Vibrio alginolyticus]MDW3056247.1 WavQ [Vibrio sp. 1978]
MKVFIYAPDYDCNSGGSVVLHRLCHLINQVEGHDAYLVPRKAERIKFNSKKEFVSSVKKALSVTIKRFRKIKVHPAWHTPVCMASQVKESNAVVLYPEFTFGNPLNAKNVVRWFLHQPGHFHREFQFGAGELYFKFNSGIKDFEYCYSKTSSHELKVIYYPLDIYNTKGVEERTIESHIVRKGSKKNKVHKDNSVPIDGMSHHEVAEILKKSKRFVSYDDYTAYSLFAVLCGCESVVVPNNNMTKEQWYPNETDRYGLAYGFDDSELEWASKTMHKVLEHIEQEHRKSFDSVRSFLCETKKHFNLI